MTSVVLRRYRHVLRSQVAVHPLPYLTFARLKYRGPSPKVIAPDTELVIDGYTRSASTFAVYAFQMAQLRPVRLAHHLHAPAQLRAAAKRGVPTLALIRKPQDAILSEVIREPGVSLRHAMAAYTRFYSCLLPYRSSFVVADFDEVTHNFGAVIRRLNQRFGTSFEVFNHGDENLQECLELMKHRPETPSDPPRILLEFESGLVSLQEVRDQLDRLPHVDERPTTNENWVPSAGRDRQKEGLRKQWQASDLSKLRFRAENVYRQFLEGDRSTR